MLTTITVPAVRRHRKKQWQPATTRPTPSKERLGRPLLGVLREKQRRPLAVACALESASIMLNSRTYVELFLSINEICEKPGAIHCARQLVLAGQPILTFNNFTFSDASDRFALGRKANPQEIRYNTANFNKFLMQLFRDQCRFGYVL
jgi:hypothetical protein